MNSKSNLKPFSVLIIMSFVFLSTCSPLNPVNDFFGIQMNPEDEANFVIVNYTNVEGITYKNSMNMNPSINAWAEISTDEVTINVTNGTTNNLPLNYTSDQFILITDKKEYYLGKGERAEYFKKGTISPKGSVSFRLELPIKHDNISQSHSGYVEGPNTTKNVIKNFSKTEGRINILKDDIKFIVCKLDKISIVLKRVPSSK